MNKIIRNLKLFIQGFLSINLIWFIGYLVSDTTVIPNPIYVYKNFGNILTDHMMIHILYSLKRIGIGLLLSLLVGIPIGILMAYSQKINRILYPFIYFGYPIPKTALLPIAMLLLGMRDGSKIVIMFLVIVFQVIVSVRDSVYNIDNVLYQVIQSNGASRWQMIWHVTLPAILPQLLTSVRVSLGAAVSILFFVEGYGTTYGVGYYIQDAWSKINYVDMYIGIITISIMGFSLFALIDYASDKLCKWNR
ncbi:NitT/TauT family transport system permease protein [Mobilisporobacter senegalensis]|uniref:NitT/TauT family transport system permease protein n=1 Tax=Mobilisporobacter senegalensis TaxID=1329262 RepID=A0A3N1XW41_9FIRM|nr:ABC transporter permease subunit [Mobilisporobacter senegalensis]ROR30488.1 NitT/TauT family transport system permease protein [Mobilisporobacter senegalensis]